LLFGNPRGATEEVLVLSHGFKLQMLTGLVRAKLAKRYRVTVKSWRQNDWSHLHDDHYRRPEGDQGMKANRL
jgi:hypothetical protein